MPPANDHLLVCVEINCLIGPASNITEHGDLLTPHREIGNGSWRANVNAHLTNINETCKLSSPSAVFRVKIRGVTIRTSIDNFNAFREVLNLLEAANRTDYLLLENMHLRLSLQNRWTDKVTFRIFINLWIPSIKDQFRSVFGRLVHIFQHLI